jgi:flagella basal body P-ring formation protein FlgA
MLRGLFILAAAGALLAKADCRQLTGDHIYGADLGGADVRFSALPKTIVIGFAPLPGRKRTFTTAELRLIARANGIPVAEFDDICFELRMAPLDRDDVVAAMRRSLPPGVTLRLLELSRAEAPAGPIAFPKEGLEPPAPSIPGRVINAQLWRGGVKYAGNLQFAILARVELSIPSPVVVANVDLAPGIPIGSSSLNPQILPLPISGAKALSSMEEVAGKLPRRLIRAGSPVMQADLVEPAVIHKGDVVSVEVDSGPARLRFEAEAEADARAGDIVDLRNPAGGKNFKARVDAEGKAAIVIRERFN